MKNWVSEKIPEIVKFAKTEEKGFILPEEAKEGLTRRISCKPEDGQKWNRRSEPTANLTPAHGRRWGRKSRETDQGLRHAQGQKCRDRGCTVNPFQFTVQRFKGSFNPEWSTKQAQFEMN
uniref:Uncharacterized protein n=1 Tax=Ficus carica TaxID=3494 RepID=A0AA88EIY6_FICCA|nr:hypothetical protein TIFTF001_056250 [Ficus carica]